MGDEPQDFERMLGGYLLKQLMQRNPGMSGISPTPPASSTPSEQPSPAISKAQAITDIINATYERSSIPDDLKYHCAKQQVIEKFGKEDAHRYFKKIGPRLSKRKTPETPVDDNQSLPKLARDTSAPRLEPAVEKKDESSLGKPILKVGDELRSILQQSAPDAASQ